MDHHKPARRRYNEKQIGALILRATDLHEEARGVSEHGLSLEEIEHIAAELGLPPEYVRTAALELEKRERSGSAFSLLGGPFVIDQARVVVETMTQEQWEQVVMELRAFTGKKGHIDEVGRTREWTHAIGEGDEGLNFLRTQVTIRRGDNETSIRIRKHYGGAAFISYAAAFFVIIFLTVILLTDEGANIGLGLGLGLGALSVVRASISLWARRQKERLKRLTNRLDQTLSASSPQFLAEEPSTELLELPELDDSERITTEARQGTRV